MYLVSSLSVLAAPFYRIFGIVILMGMSCQLLSGQAYLPTAVEGANWIIKDSETPHYPFISFVRRIEGDTVVNGQAYKKLYQQVIDHIEDEFTDPPLARPYPVFPDRELLALLRDDVEQRSVYGMVKNTSVAASQFSNDTLFHDYSLGEGDTLVGLGFARGLGAAVVTDVVEREEYGAIRRVQVTTGGNYFEGVGSRDYGPTSGGSSLLLGCCTNFIVEYCTGALPDCNVWLTPVTNLTPDLTIKTYPNPFSSRLNFTTSNNLANLSITVSLLDISGRLLRESTLSDGLQWITEDLAPGIYIATFTSGTRRETVKLVKR